MRIKQRQFVAEEPIPTTPGAQVARGVVRTEARLQTERNTSRPRLIDHDWDFYCGTGHC